MDTIRKMKIKELKEGTCFINAAEPPRSRMWRVVKLVGVIKSVADPIATLGNVELQTINLDDGEAMPVIHTVGSLRHILQYSYEIDPKSWDKAMKLRSMYLSGLNSILTDARNEAVMRLRHERRLTDK